MRPCFAILVASVGLVGCDMTEYQQRLGQHHNRLKTFDETKKLLNQVLTNPQLKYIDKGEDKTVDAWPFDIYLRLPRLGPDGSAGISGTHADMKDQGVFSHQSTMVFRYPGDTDGYNLMVAAALVKRLKEEDDVKTDKKEEIAGIEPEAFRDSVLVVVSDFYYKVYGGVLDAKVSDTKVTFEGIKPRGDKGDPVAFTLHAFEGRVPGKDKQNAFFALYIHRTKEEQAAFLFQIPAEKKDDTTEREKITRSLRTLAIGPAAAARRVEFSRLSKK